MPDFNAIAEDLYAQGWSLRPHFLSPALVGSLRADLAEGEYLNPAGIGRDAAQQRNVDIRTDSIRWLDDRQPAEREFLALMERLRLFINQRLLLGLFDYEAHFSRYAPGDFYRRHVDAFHQHGADSKPRRVLTSVVYLNTEWSAADGGELLLWDHGGVELMRLQPAAGAAVFFMSEEFPHEVLPARRERLSIAG